MAHLYDIQSLVQSPYDGKITLLISFNGNIMSSDERKRVSNDFKELVRNYPHLKSWLDDIENMFDYGLENLEKCEKVPGQGKDKLWV